MFKTPQFCKFSGGVCPRIPLQLEPSALDSDFYITWLFAPIIEKSWLHPWALCIYKYKIFLQIFVLEIVKYILFISPLMKAWFTPFFKYWTFL